MFKCGLVGYFQGGRRREFRLLRVVGRKEGWGEEEEKVEDEGRKKRYLKE